MLSAMLGRAPMVIHYVSDMARAIAFYRDVFEAAVLGESPGWSTLDFGPLVLALHILGHDDDAVLPNAGLNLLVDDIEAMATRIEALGGRLLELREPDANVPVRVAMFRDSEGNGFELRQEV